MRVVVSLLILAGLAACATPPPSAYVGRSAQTDSVARPLGKDQAGEDCVLQTAGPAAADVFCGTWQQPSAQVRRGAALASLQQAALAGPWRTALDVRVTCDAPTPTSILDGTRAFLMQCRRKVGGWPHVALVAGVGDATYYADGVLPALGPTERAVGLLSGRLAAAAAGTESGAARSAADALMASRLAAQAFSSGDIGQYETLVRLGTRANLAENFAGAEQAFRAALALQQKALGRDDPNTAVPLSYLALQISDQGRYAEADGLFAEAARRAVKASDPGARARLLHDEGLHALNQGKLPEARAFLTRAEAAFSALVPSEALAARPPPDVRRLAPGQPTAVRLAELVPSQALLEDPVQRAALLGLVETRRYLGIVLGAQGDAAASVATIASAVMLARANGLDQPILTSRLYRSAATAAAASGEQGRALTELARSAEAFAEALPGTRPIAETDLLRAGALVKVGQSVAALDLCRKAIALLRDLRAGTSDELIAPCLDAYADNADRQPTERQRLLGEMFEVAQLAQGGITSQQIALATARLSANARDPKVAEAVRRRQDASAGLADLYRQRDELAKPRESGRSAPPTTAAELDKRIADAQANLADADSALQAAAPNYGQLVQQIAPVAAVLAALHSEEAFASFALTDQGGWGFLLHDGLVAVARLKIGKTGLAALVRRVRASIEPGEAGVPRFDTAGAQDLYTDTLAPLLSGAPGIRSLVVAPSGPLLSLPFAVLLTGQGDPDALAAAPWLVRRLTVAHVPAAANFVALRKLAGSSRAARPWFGFGDFRPATLAQAERSFPGARCADSARLFAGLPPLPLARRELEAARALLGGGAGDELLGPAFTAEAVVRAALGNYRVLHFATHALLPAELKCQGEPAIVTSTPPTAPDVSSALLTSSDITGLKLDADAVILSACNSAGPGGESAGESLSGLARAFFYAGARALLVTHWSVNDQAAAFLVADSLRRLQAGDAGGLAGALRGAELGMLDDAGKGLPAALAHPFYWAPFALIGEGAGVPGSPTRQAGL